MRKYTIPLVLAVTILIAGIFALIPVDEVTAVHVTIQANTEKLDTATATADAANEDFTITCPTQSDGCYIIDAYLIDPAGGGTVDVDDITVSIDVGGIDFEQEVAADGGNEGTGADGAVDGEVIGLTGPSGFGLKPDDFLTINIDSTSTNYVLDVIAMVEGQTSIEVTVG